MVMREDFANAIPALEKLTSSRSNDPDVFNFLGFSLRKTGKLDEAKLAYERALSLSPNHRGANEYMGELYLMLNDLPKAEEHLAKLDRLCFFGCEEYTDLKQAIAQYKAKKGLAQRAAATADTGSKADSGGMADPMR
ncbi:MAG: tetratricopeptide repeat protein [Proteobacteria bacterium]|nr:tetratricopeptide repeat protein [Pseudomonadota bacterium]MBI3496821.1 tetratricopeptide repeat protein [Pseudomonadota bacterium]